MNADEFVPQWRDDDGVLYSRWRIDNDDAWPTVTMHYRCLRGLEPGSTIVLQKCKRANTPLQKKAQSKAFKGPVSFSVEQVLSHSATSKSVGTIWLRFDRDEDLALLLRAD